MRCRTASLLLLLGAVLLVNAKIFKTDVPSNLADEINDVALAKLASSHSCMAPHRFAVQGMRCQRAIEKVRHEATTSPRLIPCLAERLEIDLITGCSAYVTADYRPERGRKRKHKGAGKDDKPKHDHHRRHSCEKAYFTFHTKDMDCEEAKTRVEKVISKSSHKSQCMANASVEVLQGCDAPRTKDYRVSRVVLLCDTATNTVCADATNG
ncbi:hypothetical protein JKP88DRAFT_350127 [Tribonema minus]|uniref:Uncharacterized protein n=1 Tax=Tribonema minus TaxID=303371 RepID=A0A836CC91_9STRA|nr:hypothetical protein JKP88DRAFT_350127 [Tribonema minus]